MDHGKDKPLKQPKKPYQKPTLRVYGTIQDLTKTSNLPGPVLDAVFNQRRNS
jgi:hypothetical protein